MPVVDLRRHRHRVVLRARLPDAAGLARRDPVPRRSAWTSMCSTTNGALAARRERRARVHSALSVDAARILERSRRHASITPRTSSAFPTCGAMATGPRSPQHDGMIIYGRSDATLNPGGVRIGTAEIYRQVEKLPEVVESLVIGQDWPPGRRSDVRVVLFVQLARRHRRSTTRWSSGSRRTIRANTTPRHVPAKIVQVADIPRTKSNKIVELAVRNVVHGGRSRTRRRSPIPRRSSSSAIAPSCGREAGAGSAAPSCGR